MAGYEMELDLKVMPVGAAIQQAKLISGLTNDQIAYRMGIHPSVAKKLLAEHQPRLPDVMEVVALCNALGNTFLLEWMQAQLETFQDGGNGSVSSQFCRLSDGFARLARTTAESLEDGMINAAEANALMKCARDVREDADKIMASVAPIAGQIFTGGKWQMVPADGGRQ